MNLSNLFKKPCIIALVGNINTGKSMFLYDLIEKLNSEAKLLNETISKKINDE